MPKDNIERAIKKGTGGAPRQRAGGGPVRGLWPGRRGAAHRGGHRQPQPHGLGGPPRALQAQRRAGRERLGGLDLPQEGHRLSSTPAATPRTTSWWRLDAGAEDISLDDDVFEIITEPSSLTAVRQALPQAADIELQSVEVTQRPKVLVPHTEDTAAKLLPPIDVLEDNDDVDAVHANFYVEPEVLERVDRASTPRRTRLQRSSAPRSSPARSIRSRSRASTPPT